MRAASQFQKMRIDKFTISRDKFFLMLTPFVEMVDDLQQLNRQYSDIINFILSALLNGNITVTGVRPLIQSVMHIPGLRGNPHEHIPLRQSGRVFPGLLRTMSASLIAHWNSESPEKTKRLSDDMKLLGLTWKIEAKRIDDTQVELRVGRLPRPKQGGARDLVSIADVGFGVSQTLPVVVALQAANPGQLVYIEQPEIHLHPRAQVAMARLLVNAANRGVRVVAKRTAR